MGANYRVLNQCVLKEEIKDKLFYIENSINFYITKNLDIYKYYENYGYYKMKQHINSQNGYIYCAVKYKNGIKGTERVHRIIANTFIPNPNNMKVVGHKDNNKANNSLDNLYWTTTQENSQKAVDDKLSEQPRGAENQNSNPIKVVNLDGVLVAVYGSMCETERYIENLNKGYLSKMLTSNTDYKPRNKKYKYMVITKEEYDNTPTEYKFKKLYELQPIPKMVSIFRATNLYTNGGIICDNQKQFAKRYGLEQAMISNAIKLNGIYGGFRFEFIEKVPYSKGSGYKNLIALSDNVSIRNIVTGEERHYDCVSDLKKDLGIKGHSVKLDGLILEEWQVI